MLGDNSDSGYKSNFYLRLRTEFAQIGLAHIYIYMYIYIYNYMDYPWTLHLHI